MLGPRHNLEVLDSIVRRILVDVVDDLVRL
jgi:hypothetical protein